MTEEVQIGALEFATDINSITATERFGFELMTKKKN